ncbi:hydantoinase/carbamoylase family amidase [Pseudorhodoplanes sp.]|uniref:hydantoinase/carbamoylase family amidase n=1 Tax=Pseudorhodoplanes sp. TaxID=1934341 RepID=UPI003D14A696
MLQVNAERLLSNLRSLAAIGGCGSGVKRIAFSEEDVVARLWLVDRFREADLDAGMDGVGNVYGLSKAPNRRLLIGSHTDTVPSGGWLDGSLGVIFALEIALRLREENRLEENGVDVVSFADEEGTYFSWLGSRYVCGEMTDAKFDAARNAAGRPLREALKALPSPFGPSLSLDRYCGYFESHIEQGPYLERTGNSIGAVTSIVGIRNHIVRFFGRADHAGTTPMSMREDASLQLFDFVTAFRQALEENASSESVWVFGNAMFSPGASNVVPAQADLLVQYRDPNPDILAKMDALMKSALRRVERQHQRATQVTTIMESEPVAMDANLRHEIAAAAKDLGVSYADIPSGAGHDAAAIGAHLPTAMLFVPSKGGRSHTFEEDTDERDIVVGANVALNAAYRILQR